MRLAQTVEQTTEVRARLAWHEPELRLLVINVGTQGDPGQAQLKTGSGEDLGVYGYLSTN